ncbi:putative acetyltransferase [Bremerella volcania]|uniref:Putative acetyltransferase n=1 Tax=Bremerella volcania TaxID=2527984 RepID=A0A518C922_9BACT|nr:GNAT family N-acetyltransferase [Bremerella volcania]QDU75733.1 putative acetyltransferase [Bremerella volcania]
MVTIRAAQPSDSTELQALFERFIRSADWLPEGSVPEADFAKTTEGERVYVAVLEDGQLIGAVTVWEPESFIHCLFVDHQYQGQGIGTKLMESLTQWLPFPWKLKCLATNRRALDFYRRQGWKKLETGLGDQGTYFLLGREADSAGTT